MSSQSGSEQKRLRRLRLRAAHRQKNACYWCGAEMVQPNGPDTDQDNPLLCTADHHPVPRHRGGRTVEGNIVAACKRCNSTRHPELDRSPATAPVSYSTGDNGEPQSPLRAALLGWKPAPEVTS